MYKSRDDVQLKILANDKPPSVHPEQKPPLQIIGDISEKKLTAHKMSEEGNLIILFFIHSSSEQNKATAEMYVFYRLQ